MITSYEILAIDNVYDVRNRTQVVAHDVTFRFLCDDGTIIGPRIERRSPGEDHDAFVSGIMASFPTVASITPEEELKQLLQCFFQYSDDVIKTVTGISDQTLSDIRISLQG